MPTITNEPILLDSTGRELLDEMRIQSGHLAMIAEGSRTQVYSSMRQIADLVRGGDVARNAKMFPIGDQIIMPWKDMDDANHNTDETAYQVAWDIVHHGEVELRDGSIVPGMFIQMHLCSAYGVQFSHQQAFMNCPDGLAAGTYHVTFDATFGNKGANAGTTWQFTLTKAVPAGGRISGFEEMSTTLPSTWRVKTWSSPSSATPLETVTVSSGNSGTGLGVMQLDSVSDDGLNSMQATGCGHNRWSTSALRQYLNKSGANWWASQEDFDIRPDQYNKQGFMTGFDAEFLNAIKPVKVTTALNDVEGFTNAIDETFDTFFLPSLQQMNVRPHVADAEGDVFEYWRARLGMRNYTNWNSSYCYDAFKIPSINNNSAQMVRFRSANIAYAAYMRFLYPMGFVTYDSASNAILFTPVCVIC